MLTLDKFEEASEKVKEATTETKLIYSEFFSNQCGNKVYLKPENLQNLESYLEWHFDKWLEKYASTPECMAAEMSDFAHMEI